LKLNTLRFGEIETSSNVWTFADGLPGLEEYHNFVLLAFPDTAPVAWLQSTEEPGCCLPVVYTFAVLPDYSFDVTENTQLDLELGNGEDFAVFNVLIIHEDLTKMTANLAAPILVNTKTGKAVQILLSDDRPLRYPIFEDISRYANENAA